MARLGLAGETFVTAARYDDSALGDALRRSAVLVISERNLPEEQESWERTLRDCGWAGNIIVLMEVAPTQVQPATGLILIPRKRAAATILSLLDDWRGPGPGDAAPAAGRPRGDREEDTSSPETGQLRKRFEALLTGF